MTDRIPGSCLCGAVRFEVWGPFEAFHLCHCSRCRKSTGSAHASNIFTGPDHIEWLAGIDSVVRFDLPTAERFAKCFCSTCGSLVPYVNRPRTALLIPAGSLDADPGVRPDDHIFCADRGAWEDAAATAPRFDSYPE